MEGRGRVGGDAAGEERKGRGAASARARTRPDPTMTAVRAAGPVAAAATAWFTSAAVSLDGPTMGSPGADVEGVSPFGRGADATRGEAFQCPCG